MYIYICNMYMYGYCIWPYTYMQSITHIQYTHIIKIIQCTIHVWTILKPLITNQHTLAFGVANEQPRCHGKSLHRSITHLWLVAFDCWPPLRFFMVFLDQIWQIDTNRYKGAAKLVTKFAKVHIFLAHFGTFWHVEKDQHGSTHQPYLLSRIAARKSMQTSRTWGSNRTSMDHQWHWQ